MQELNLKNKVLLLDFDGTLVDTEKLAIQVIEQYCVDKNLISQATTLKKISKTIIGRTWQSAIAEMNRLHPMKVDLLELEHDLKKIYHALLSGGVEWIPGVHEKLDWMKKNSMAMGIVTGSSLNEVETILAAEKNFHLFDLIWSAENYRESKPSPEPFLTAFEHLKEKLISPFGFEVHPHDVIVFEDSLAGMDSAHQAGFSFVQILHAHPEMPIDPRALVAVKDWRDLRFR